MAEVVSLYGHSQAIEAKIANVHAQMAQATKFRAKFEEKMSKLQRASAVSSLLYMLIGRRTWRRVPISH